MNLLEDIAINHHWIDQANCKNMDTNLFFPELSINYSDFVREVCFSCPVIEECAWYANETSAIYGMFGGMSPSERELWRSKNKIPLGISREDWEAQ